VSAAPAEPRPTSAPARTLEQEAFLQIQRCAEALAYSVAELLRPYALTPTQYNALRILRGAGEPGATCGEIGERLVNRVPDVSRLVDRLERSGLVARSRRDADRRVVRVNVTPAGLDLLAELDEPVLALHRRQLGHLGEAELRRVVEVMEGVRRRLE
jgi:DNA-binding MarR family transcriptional regulator